MTIIQLIRKNQIHFSEDNKIETWKNNNISKTGYFLKNSSWNIELNAFTALFIFNGKENILIEEINKNAKMISFSLENVNYFSIYKTKWHSSSNNSI